MARGGRGAGQRNAVSLEGGWEREAALGNRLAALLGGGNPPIRADPRLLHGA